MEARELGARVVAVTFDKLQQSNRYDYQSGTTGAVLEIRVGTGGADAMLFDKDV